MVDIALDQFCDDPHRHGFHLGRRDEGEGVNELVPRQGEGKNTSRNEPWHRQRQDDLPQNLKAGGAINQSALFQLEGNRAEVAHQQPSAKGNQESGVGEDQRPAGVKQAQLENDGRQRDEQNRGGHQIGQKNAQAHLARAFEAQALNGISRQHRTSQRHQGGDDRNEHCVPQPLGVGGFKQQFVEMLQGGLDHPKRVAVTRKQFVVGLDRGDDHPVKRKQQHKHKNTQRRVYRYPTGACRVQIAHALAIVVFCVAHLSVPPCCQARLCNPK